MVTRYTGATEPWLRGPKSWRGSAAISLPLIGYRDHQLKLLGRLATSANRAVDVFEVGVQGPAPLYRKSVEVRPGTYRWTITVKDVTTGGLAKDTIDFVVK